MILSRLLSFWFLFCHPKHQWIWIQGQQWDSNRFYMDSIRILIFHVHPFPPWVSGKKNTFSKEFALPWLPALSCMPAGGMMEWWNGRNCIFRMSFTPSMSQNIIITSHELLVREISNVAIAAVSRCGSLLSRTTSTKHCLPFARSVAMCGSPGSDGEQITKTLFEVYKWHDIYKCVSWKPIQFQYTWILSCEGKNAGSWFLPLHRHGVTSPEVYAFASILTFGFLQESRWFRGSLPTMLGLQKRGTQEHGTIVFMFSFFWAEGITCQQL